MLGSTVKQSSKPRRRRLNFLSLESTGILTCFPFNSPAFLRPGVILLERVLGPTDPKRNTLFSEPSSTFVIKIRVQEYSLARELKSYT